MSSTSSSDEQLDIIDDRDRDKTLIALVAGAGPNGIARSELERQYIAAIDWVADQKLGGLLHHMVLEERLALTVDQDGEVHMTNRKETP